MAIGTDDYPGGLGVACGFCREVHITLNFPPKNITSPPRGPPANEVTGKPEGRGGRQEMMGVNNWDHPWYT